MNDVVALQPKAMLQTLKTHAVRVVLPFELRASPGGELVGLTSLGLDKVTLASLTATPFRLVSPDRAKPAPIFEVSSFLLGDDLHEVVAVAFGASAASADASRSTACLKLTAAGQAVVNGVSLRPKGDPATLAGYRRGSGPVLHLTRSARERLAAAGCETRTEVILSIDELQLLLLTSGIGFVVVMLRIAEPAPDLNTVQELVHAITHARRGTLGWACLEHPQSLFSLHTLVATLLAGTACELIPSNRIFSYTLAHHALAGAADIQAAAWRLSRHYNSDYLPTKADEGRGSGTVFLQPFESVLHAASLEGVATLVEGTGEHAAHALAGTMVQRYFALALLALHEHVMLLRLSERAAGAHAVIGIKSDAAQLRHLLARFLLFRRRFRIPLASEVTMHNLAYDAFRKALCNDSLDRKMREDVTEASRHLQFVTALARKRTADRRERGRAPFQGLLTFMLTLLTSLAAVKELRTIVSEYVHVEDARWIGTGMFAVCLVMAAIAGWYATSRHLDSHEIEEDDNLEALDEHLHDEAVSVARENQHLSSQAHA